MLFWLALFLLVALVFGAYNTVSNQKQERDIRMRRIKRRLVQKEREQAQQNSNNEE